VSSRNNYRDVKDAFEESLAIIYPLLRKIQETDYEIDHMTYELYGLNEGENSDN